MGTLEMLNVCQEHGFINDSNIQDDQVLYCLLISFRVLILISLKIIIEDGLFHLRNSSGWLRVIKFSELTANTFLSL